MLTYKILPMTDKLLEDILREYPLILRISANLSSNFRDVRDVKSDASDHQLRHKTKSNSRDHEITHILPVADQGINHLCRLVRVDLL